MAASKKLIILIVILVLGTVGLFFYYSQQADSKRFFGSWKASWKTSPASFAGIDAFTDFEMDGEFIFTKDSVTIIANGFPGCVFGVDTLSHTQAWKLSVAADTLDLISEGGMVGISYKINGLSDQFVELQLLEDIFISLEKVEE
jgi:hypothetical protein